MLIFKDILIMQEIHLILNTTTILLNTSDFIMKGLQ
jgi:hypothetical protein